MLFGGMIIAQKNREKRMNKHIERLFTGIFVMLGLLAILFAFAFIVYGLLQSLEIKASPIIIIAVGIGLPVAAYLLGWGYERIIEK